MVPQKNLSVSDGEVFLFEKRATTTRQQQQPMKLQGNNSTKLMLNGSYDIFFEVVDLKSQKFENF